MEGGLFVFKKIKYYINNLGKAVCLLGYHKFFFWLSDRAFIKLVWRLRYHTKLNLSAPTGYAEKIQWLKLYDHNPIYPVLVDKLSVRDYIADLIGSKYLIPLHSVFDSVKSIDWESLPNKFVMKCTHDSGYVLVCKDKTVMNIKLKSKELSKRYRRSIYWYGREWQYKHLKPKILVEQLIESNSEYGLIDYKVFCFNGKAKLIQVHTGRFTNHIQQFYDLEWNLTDISHIDIPSTNEYTVEKPDCYNEMIELSEKLSQVTCHARIDWYYAQGKLYFSEFTFYDGSGFVSFSNPEHDLLLGSWIDLSKVIRKEKNIKIK